MVTPCLKGLMWKLKQKVNCWDSCGALERILSHDLKLLQETRKELGMRAHLGSCSCSCPGSHWIIPFSFSSLAVCWKFTLWSSRAWCLLCTSSGTFRHIPVMFSHLSVSVLLVGSSAQSHRGVYALEPNPLIYLQCSSAHTLYSTGEFGLCLFFLGFVMILAGHCLLLFKWIQNFLNSLGRWKLHLPLLHLFIYCDAGNSLCSARNCSN